MGPDWGGRLGKTWGGGQGKPLQGSRAELVSEASLTGLPQRPSRGLEDLLSTYHVPVPFSGRSRTCQEGARALWAPGGQPPSGPL